MEQTTLVNEDSIIDCLLNVILNAGYCVSVNDGEETVVVRSTDKEEIVSSLRSTESDWIRIFKPGEAYHVGSIELIYNNGSDGVDLISNTAANDLDALDQLLIPVYEFIETL